MEVKPWASQNGRKTELVDSLPPDLAEPDETYRAVLAWIWSFSARARSDSELTAQRAAKLDRMRAMLAALDQPQQTYPTVLVAGTKGKGSTVAMIAAALQASGRRTGRYTSPHLVNWRERTCIDAQPMSTQAVVALEPRVRAAVERLPEALGQPTTFEVGTAFALLHFAQQHVDIAVLEVGVGGRYDATNLVEPEVGVVTPISYDHTPTLGDTLSAIAWHKAGILRPARPAITAPQVPEALHVIQAEAARLGSHLEEVGRDWWCAELPGGSVEMRSKHADFPAFEARIALLGAHQRDNATTAVAALHALQHVRPDIAPTSAGITAGLEQVDWPGRLQVLHEHPLIVFDGAHNGASAQALRRAIEEVFSFARLHLVVGLTAGKDARGVLDELAPAANAVYLTRAQHERSNPPTELEPLVRERSQADVTTWPGVAAALDAAVQGAGPEDMVLVTGSLFVVGEGLVWWQASRSSR